MGLLLDKKIEAHTPLEGKKETVIGFNNRKTGIERYITTLVDEVVYSGLELPLVFLMKLMNDPSKDVLVRMEAAKALMPYIHRKKPVAIESTKQDLSLAITLTQKQLESLDDEQLATFTNIVKKLTVPGTDGDGTETASFVEASEVLPGHRPSEEGALSEASGVFQGRGGAS